MAILEMMLADKRADDRARAERFARVTSPLATIPDCREESLTRVVVSNFSTATRSGTGNPLPADTSARGELIEDLAWKPG